MEHEEQPSGSVFRHKSPTFRKSETLLLIKLIDKYKNPLLIKSTLHSVTYIKDKAWAELTKEFNMLSENTEFERTFDVLKTKWDNLKRLAKKCSRNGLDPTDESCDEIVKHVTMLCGAEVGPLEMVEPDSDDETETKDQTFNRSTNHDTKKWNRKAALDSDVESEKKRIVTFSPRDCRLLLHCVRQEKNVLFANTPSARKQKAWSRVAQAFNRQSPSKRTPRELKQKFQNLKYMASRIKNSKSIFTKSKRKTYELLSDNREDHKVKMEPKSDGSDDLDMDNEDDVDGVDHNGSLHSELNDPLSNGITVHSGLGLSNHSKTSEIDKLKLEILNYEMETAQLQRKRIEDAIAAEKSDRETQVIVNALRIRTARLEVIAAESKLPSLHPALSYTPEEAPGHQYLTYRAA